MLCSLYPIHTVYTRVPALMNVNIPHAGSQIESSVETSLSQPTVTNCPATTKPELRQLIIELYPKVADKWEDIGIMLKIDSGKLDALKTTENRTSQACLREMLKIWLKLDPSWITIIDALKILGEKELASHLRATYCSRDH